MKRVVIKITALAVALALLLCGCGLDFGGYFDRLAGLFGVVSFDNMEYTRPDLSPLDGALEDCLESAQRGNNLNELLECIYTLNAICSSYQTNYRLAYIHYSMDLTDTYWETEYNYCAQQSTAVQAAVDELMYALADCALRSELEAEDYFGAGYFDDYDGESIWTEEFSALMDQETYLINHYYDLSAQAMALDPDSDEYKTICLPQLESLYLELVKLRKRIAVEAGYSSYSEFAYDFYYARDYTPAQAEAYLGEIRTELVPLYRRTDFSKVWLEGLEDSTESQTFRYVQTMAQAMGGSVADSFSVMDDAGLYDISYSENKYAASFEVFLPDYMVPFVLMNPTMTGLDRLTFAHEFGHFCNDYASGGTGAGIDVSEFFSQGMEYLSLSYADGGQELAKLKMADSLCVFVEQAALADFEAQVYALSDNKLTVSRIRNLYRSISITYGFSAMVDDTGYVDIGHLYTSPMYVISYVVSNDAAMQLYQLESEQAGSGLACYTDNLVTGQIGFLEFLEEAGLESPFAPGRITAVKKTFEAVL